MTEDQTPATISVIDDDASVRSALHRLLRSLGYAVHAFESAVAFCDSSLRDETDCIITDVQMPGMSGLQLLARLRDQGKHTPVIFVTGFFDETTRQRAIQGGAACFLGKPFSAEDIIGCVEQALKGI